MIDRVSIIKHLDWAPKCEQMVGFVGLDSNMASACTVNGAQP